MGTELLSINIKQKRDHSLYERIIIGPKKELGGPHLAWRRPLLESADTETTRLARQMRTLLTYAFDVEGIIFGNEVFVGLGTQDRRIGIIARVVLDPQQSGQLDKVKLDLQPISIDFPWSTWNPDFEEGMPYRKKVVMPSPTTFRPPYMVITLQGGEERNYRFKNAENTLRELAKAINECGYICRLTEPEVNHFLATYSEMREGARQKQTEIPYFEGRQLSVGEME